MPENTKTPDHKEALDRALDFCLGSMGEYGAGSPEFTAYKNCHTFIERLARELPPASGAFADHKAEALRLLGYEEAPGQALLAALVHSNLAIAEGQERVAKATEDQNHWLEEIANQLSRAQS